MKQTIRLGGMILALGALSACGTMNDDIYNNKTTRHGDVVTKTDLDGRVLGSRHMRDRQQQQTRVQPQQQECDCSAWKQRARMAEEKAARLQDRLQDSMRK